MNRFGNNRGKTTLVIMVAIILVMAVMMVILEPPAKIELTPEEEADAAFSAYKIAAWNYVQSQGTTRGVDLKNTIFRPDWLWYEENYDSLFSDTFKLMDAVNVTAQKELKMTIVMQNILRTGVHRPDSEVISRRKESDNLYIFRVKQIEGQDLTGNNIYQEYDVKLVKEGIKWKVQEFGGALPVIKQMGQAGGIGPGF